MGGVLKRGGIVPKISEPAIRHAVQGQSFAFGPFVFSLEAGTLLRHNSRIPVGYRGLLLLAALAKRPGEVLTKSELMDTAWPGKIVEESNLTVQIAALRKILGPAPDGAEWITTVPRLGYRLTAAIETFEGAGLRIENKPSLAVLPFDNASGEPEQGYFADGITEDIITELSKFSGLFVVARNSSFVYKHKVVDIRQVARELGVRYVLEGSVRRAGNRLRITGQLIEGTAGTHVWAAALSGWEPKNRGSAVTTAARQPMAHVPEIAVSGPFTSVPLPRTVLFPRVSSEPSFWRPTTLFVNAEFKMRAALDLNTRRP